MISGVSAIWGTHLGLFLEMLVVDQKIHVGLLGSGDEWVRMYEDGRKWGIHLTKLPASMCLRPAELKRSISSIFVCVGTTPFSFCSPSRAPTSTIFTTPLLLLKGWSTVMFDASVVYSFDCV